MKKNLLLLLLLTPFITNTTELDYHYALHAAIESKDKEKVQNIIDQLPKKTDLKTTTFSYYSKNPLFIDTSPEIIKILLDSGAVSIEDYKKDPLFDYYPVDRQTNYKSVALLLSRGGEFSKSRSLECAISQKKDHRIICALLMAGADPENRLSFNFYTLKQLIQKDSSSKNHDWGFLNWAAMTIATEKKEEWKQKLKEIISLYPTPQLEILNPRKIQERQRTGILNIEKLIFQKRYKDAFESWLDEKDY